MIKVEYMKPFYTKIKENKLILTFAYQYFTIEKDEEKFHFIPIESKDIIINMDNDEIENLSDVFVFQRGNRFIRLPLYQLLLVSDVRAILDDLISQSIPNNYNEEEEDSYEDFDDGLDVDFDEEVYDSITNDPVKIEKNYKYKPKNPGIEALIEHFTSMNRERSIELAIDKALDERNEEEFKRLIEMKNNGSFSLL